MQRQKTIARPVEFTGQSLHLGRQVSIAIRPAGMDSGLLFRRVDLPGSPSVRANLSAVVDTRRSVSVGRDDWRVGTIEHLLAAVHGLGLDNLEIESDGEELPEGDGSALCFVDLLLRAGLVEQESRQRIFQVREAVWVAEGHSYLIALPPEQPGLSISYTFSADRRPIPAQHFEFNLGSDDFLRELAPARTVAFMEEIEALRRQGLAQSNNLDVAVIVGPDGYENKLRLPDEIVRHKILDLLGDLFLFGRLHGRIVAVRSGHRLNLRLGQTLACSDHLREMTETGAKEGV